MEAVLLPSLIGSGEKTAVYLEPVPLNSESEPPLTLIDWIRERRSAWKSADLGRSSNSGERIIAVIAIFSYRQLSFFDWIRRRIGSEERCPVEPVPLKGERINVDIAIFVEIRGGFGEFKFNENDSPTISLEAGADCDGGRSGVRWRCNGEGERIIVVIAIFVEVTGSI